MKEFISAEEVIYRFISVHSIFWYNFSPFFIFYCPIFLNLYIKAQLYFLFFVLFYPFSLKQILFYKPHSEPHIVMLEMANDLCIDIKRLMCMYTKR